MINFEQECSKLLRRPLPNQIRVYPPPSQLLEVRESVADKDLLLHFASSFEVGFGDENETFEVFINDTPIDWDLLEGETKETRAERVHAEEKALINKFLRLSNRKGGETQYATLERLFQGGHTLQESLVSYV